MTEAEWLACTKPDEMLLAIAKPGDERKWRLVCCSVCRTTWHLLQDERIRTAVEVADRCADDRNVLRETVFKQANNDACVATNEIESVNEKIYEAASAVMSLMYASTGALTVGHLMDVFRHAANGAGEKVSFPLQAQLIRDIFGNPFRPVATDPAWQTSTVLALARQMYESRDFTAMPILADALQDAGCENADILGHCRGEGPHVRGCWVVDLILGKE